MASIYPDEDGRREVGTCWVVGWLYGALGWVVGWLYEAVGWLVGWLFGVVG